MKNNKKTDIDPAKCERVARALQEMSTIIEKSPAVVFLWKNEDKWPVEFVSKNVETLFGYTAEEFISGRVNYTMMVHPKDISRVEEEVTYYSGEKGRTAFAHKPYRIITKSGQEKWVDDSTFIRRGEKDKITHYQGIVTDITERKQTEEALKEKVEEIKKMNKSMIGRELKMAELKKENEELKKKLSLKN